MVGCFFIFLLCLRFALAFLRFALVFYASLLQSSVLRRQLCCNKVFPSNSLFKELWVLGWELFYVFYHILLEILSMQSYIIYCNICVNFKLTRGTYAQHLLVQGRKHLRYSRKPPCLHLVQTLQTLVFLLDKFLRLLHLRKTRKKRKT